MKHLRIILLVCVFLSGIFILPAQIPTNDSGRNYSETVFVAVNACKGDIVFFLEQGARAFILSGERPEAHMNRCFPVIAKFLSTHPNEIVSFLLPDNRNAATLRQALKHFGLERWVWYSQENDPWPAHQTMISQNKRLVVFAKTTCQNVFSCDRNILFGDFNRLISNGMASPKSLQTRLICYNPLPDGLLQTSQDTLLLHRAFYLWNQRGQIPNFLISSPSNLQASVWVADSINRTPFYTGRFLFDNKPIGNIHRTLRKEVVYNHTFTIPFTSPYGNLFTPWKEGYRFYPEIIKFDFNHTFQEISAFKLNLDDDLLYHFTFENGLQNEADHTHKDKLSLGVLFKSDKVHGEVAVFNTDGAAIQCENNVEFRTNKPFTVSAWVKPYRVDGIYAILGKGQIFSVKIRYKELSFAGTDFNSIITNSVEVKPNVWQHFTWVCVPNYHVQTFVNGKLIDEQKIGKILEDDYAVTIGNNFTKESFYGEIDELRIWNRALSQDEINDVFLLKPKSRSPWLVYIGLVAALIAFFLLFFRRRRTKAADAPKPAAAVESVSVAPMLEHGIFLFGPLSVINDSGEDLSPLFTPKMKQLFLLLILNERGVSISQINEELWPGIDEEKAKQSRNYTIQQLKKVIARIAGFELEYHSKSWVLTISDKVFVDIAQHQKLVQQIVLGSKDAVALAQRYVALVERGKFLQGVDIESFDPIKARVSDQIVESLLFLAQNADSKLRLHLGNALLLHDSLNEDGLRLCLKSLTELGRNGEAHAIYNSFCKRYQSTYNEDFSSPFLAFV